MPKVDPDTEEIVRRILIISRNRGADPVIAMGTAGLIRDKSSIMRDWEQCLDALIESVEATPSSTIQEWEIPRTALDLKNAIVEILMMVKEKTFPPSAR